MKQAGPRVSVALLVALAVLLFIGVTYVPPAVTDSEGTRAAVALGLRLLGFSALLAAGALLVRTTRSR